MLHTVTARETMPSQMTEALTAVVTLNGNNLGKQTTKIVQNSTTKIVVSLNGNNIGKLTTKIVPPVFWLQRTCGLVTFLLKSN